MPWNIFYQTVGNTKKMILEWIFHKHGYIRKIWYGYIVALRKWWNNVKINGTLHYEENFYCFPLKLFLEGCKYNMIICQRYKSYTTFHQIYFYNFCNGRIMWLRQNPFKQETIMIVKSFMYLLFLCLNIYSYLSSLCVKIVLP